MLVSKQAVLHQACCHVAGRNTSLLLGMACRQALTLPVAAKNTILRFTIVLLVEKWSSKRFIYLEASCKTDKKKMPPLFVDFSFKREKPCGEPAKPSGRMLLAAITALTTARDCSDRFQSSIHSVKLVLNYDNPLASPHG